MDQLLDRGHEAQRAGRMAKAEKLYLRALQEAEKLGDSSAKLANVLISVANVYHAKGDMEKAISLTERALAIDEKALGPEHWLVGRDLSNLAMLYQRQNPTAAEEYTRRVLELVETSPRLDNAHRLLFLRNAAGFYCYQGRDIEAETLLKRALEITGRSQAAGIRGELAWLYAKEGNKVDAEKILLDGISPAKPQNGNVAGQDDSVWFTLLQLAEQYKAEGRIQEAEDCYNRAIAIPETDPKAVAFLDQALDELGDLYESEGRDQEAENLFLRALNLREQSATPKRPDFAGLLSFPFALLNLYRGLGRLSEMEPIFQRALAIQEHVLGLDDARVGETLIQLARIYREEAKNAQALPLYQRSVEFAENNLSADDPRLTFLLRDYAGLLDEVGQKAQAARMRARADQATARNPQR